MTTPRHGGLGRGLGALIPQANDGDLAVAGARFAEVPVDRIAPNPSQPRSHFDAEALAELVTSIREVGLLQPVVVRQTGPESYELVMGERRLRAAKEAGLERIPAIVRDTGDDVMLRDALLENLHRQQLNPLEEAAAYSQLLSDFGATHEELADKIGRSRSTISNTIRLLQLPTAVQRRVAAGVLSAGHARAILSLSTAEAQERMAERVVAEGMSVRGVEEAVTLAGGEDDAPARKPRSRKDSPAEFGVVADRLAERFETRVKVDSSGKGRGRVVIEFAGLEDLQRILDVIDAPPATA
jgi:ParB family chromosome partitioning protein